MQLGNAEEEVLHHFRSALAICHVNEIQRGNEGESARVKWRMATVMEAQGLKDEEAKLRGSAVEMRRRLRGTGEYPTVGLSVEDEEDEEGWDCLLGMLYR